MIFVFSQENRGFKIYRCFLQGLSASRVWYQIRSAHQLEVYKIAIHWLAKTLTEIVFLRVVLVYQDHKSS